MTLHLQIAKSWSPYLLSVLKTLVPCVVYSEFKTLRGLELLLQLACCSASRLVLSCLDKLYRIFNHTAFFFSLPNFIFFNLFKDKLATLLSRCFHVTLSVHRISKSKILIRTTLLVCLRKYPFPETSHYLQLLWKMHQIHSIKFIIGKWHEINYGNASQF